MALINDIRRDIKNDIKTAMKIRPPWWSVLCVMIAVWFAYPLFDNAGKLYLVMPIGASVTVLAVTTVIKWKLKRFAWFWITIAIIAALHALLIVFVPWTSSWVPAVVTATIASADGIAMLAIIDVIARLMARTNH